MATVTHGRVRGSARAAGESGQGRVYRRQLDDRHRLFVKEFVAQMSTAGFRADDNRLTNRARTFCRRFDTPAGWLALDLHQQLALPNEMRNVVAWCLCTQRLSGPEVIDCVLAVGSLGSFAARLHAAFHRRFTAMAATLGNSAHRNAGRDWQARQWLTLTRLAIVAGIPAQELTSAQLDAARQALWRVLRDRGEHTLASRLNTSLFEIQASLFHLGQVDEFPQWVNLAARCDFQRRWDAVAPAIAATFTTYLQQRATVRAKATVVGERQTLLGFAEYLATHTPEVARVDQLRRAHIESYKRHLASEPAQRKDRPVGKRTVYRRLALLRTVFDHLAETGHPDAPQGRLVLPDDLPIPDRPLPRFIDDPAAAKLLQAARAHPDFFVRLSVEFLARTGLRIGEFLDLTTDAVVQIGSGYWLRVPLGKLHNDRFIPLHPQLKELLDQWVADRPAGLRTSYLFLDRGRRISRARVRRGLADCARTAGIGHASPHQLRHTLATQAKVSGIASDASFGGLCERRLRGVRGQRDSEEYRVLVWRHAV